MSYLESNKQQEKKRLKFNANDKKKEKVKKL